MLRISAAAGGREVRARAEAAAAVRHPSLVEILEIFAIGGDGEDGGAVVTVERAWPGTTLGDVLRDLSGMEREAARPAGRDRLPGSGSFEARAAALGARIADALAALHAAGVAHGALGPDAILLDAAGEARLRPPALAPSATEHRAPEPDAAVDLADGPVERAPGGADGNGNAVWGTEGGAKGRGTWRTDEGRTDEGRTDEGRTDERRRDEERGDGGRTGEGGREGGGPPALASPLAPERWGGGAWPTPASDLFELGWTLYVLLALRPPFSGLGAELARAVREDDPVRPTRVQPCLLPGADAILLQALQRAPERRPASAASLADDLRALSRGEAVAAPMPGGWRRALGELRARRSGIAEAILLVGFGVAGAIRRHG